MDKLVGIDQRKLFQVKYEEVQVKYEPQHLEEEDETTNQERDWTLHQGKRQHRQHKAPALEDGGDTAQLLGFSDPGLTYLAHSSGLGALTDPGHPSHHPANLHPVSEESRGMEISLNITFSY